MCVCVFHVMCRCVYLLWGFKSNTSLPVIAVLICGGGGGGGGVHGFTIKAHFSYIHMATACLRSGYTHHVKSLFCDSLHEGSTMCLL